MLIIFLTTGDGLRPICRNCTKANRKCLGANEGLKFVIHTNDQSLVQQNRNPQDQQPSHPLPPILAGLEQKPQGEQELDALVAANPRAALANLEIAEIFRHYIDVLAPWYDLCDSEHLFGNTVPLRALENSTLFRAVIAFSAYHRSKISGYGPVIGLAFHAACVKDLLKVVDNFQLGLRGDYLAATCLLRDSRKQQQHLLGAYLFSSNEPLNMSHSGLAQAGAWNYLREEITVALECNRPVRLGFEFHFNPSESYTDSMRANIMSHLLARTINHCFHETEDGLANEGRQQSWQDLQREVSAWKANLPASFDPFSTAVKEENPFPSLWLVHPWHVAAQQYCAIAEILLAIYDPFSPIDREFVLEQTLKVCGLAYTNDNVAARVNVFGPLAYCGKYLQTSRHRQGLMSMLREFALPTAWPVGCIIEDLERCWSLRHEA
ncbi:hypothetical protein BP6252_01972 [Coleophoma cylindrospora]|uniref:Zn(2)-C6 fungal-type domain-containing protein n=1 Tax=Coleophoma cylindrospora TaxID=1849047 RepID=A0A3D8SDI5_9HELO|nr:hypothetical protein BP6252_01972 [Coleophoma cylindrospora]